MSVRWEMLPFEFYILGAILLLSLIAAIGAWRSPSQLSRDEAEDLFAGSHERSAAESHRLRVTLAEAQSTNAEKLAALRAEVQELLGAMREVLESTTSELRGTLAQATEEQRASIVQNLGDLSTNVTAALTEAKRSQDEGIGKVEDTLQQVRNDVDRASKEVKTSIVELQRQHNEAKAQSAIQLCEALISSLGTLRNTIAAQIADTRSAEVLITERREEQTQTSNPEAEEQPQQAESSTATENPSGTDTEGEVSAS